MHKSEHKSDGCLRIASIQHENCTNINRQNLGSNMTTPTPIPDTTRFSEEEWQLRIQLAACYRAFVHYGWTDSIFTHLSARVPGHPNQYLINPYGLLFHEINASNLIKVDFDGNLIEGDYSYNEAGHSIHSAVLSARPDIQVVLHSHTRAGMAVSCMKCGLLPLTQQANEIRDMICYHDYGIARNNDEECQRLGQDLADKCIMIMHNHGLLTVGRSVAEAFYYLYTVENACKVQVDVLASGREFVTPREDMIDQFAQEGLPPADQPHEYVNMAWDAVIRLLDEKDSSYRD
ncbi:MAG: class II aldolase/adducin family protein [Gammaproteobacteria bacterium]|nr:class II aldolase/adducin family protein [Gammaproteobacteria bacterium]